MVFQTSNVTISENLDLTSIATQTIIPTAQRDDGVTVVVLPFQAGKGPLDKNNSVPVFSAVENAWYILFYDINGILLNTNGNLRIKTEDVDTSHFENVCIVAGEFLHIAFTTKAVNTLYPIRFYNEENDNTLNIVEPVLADPGMAILATYRYGASPADWMWSRTIQVNNKTFLPAGTDPKIDNSLLNSLTSESLIWFVSSISTLQLYNGGVKVLQEYPGSAMASFVFGKGTGDFVATRGFFVPSPQTSVNGQFAKFSNISRSSFGNLLIAAGFVDAYFNNVPKPDFGLFFQVTGVNQGESLPSGYKSCLISVFNPLSVLGTITYSLMFAGFPITLFDKDKLQCCTLFDDSNNGHLIILGKLSSGDDIKFVTSGGAFGGSNSPITLSSLKASSGWVLFRFTLNSKSRELILTHISGFEGLNTNTANVKMNPTGLLSRLGPIKTYGIAESTNTIELFDISGSITKVHNFIVNTYTSSVTNLTYTEDPTIPTIELNTSVVTATSSLWMCYSDKNNKLLTYYTSVNSTAFFGTLGGVNIKDNTTTIALNYSHTGPVEIATPFLDESLYSNSSSGMSASLLMISNSNPRSVWDTGLGVLLGVGCFILVLLIVMIYVKIYIPARDFSPDAKNLKL